MKDKGKEIAPGIFVKPNKAILIDTFRLSSSFDYGKVGLGDQLFVGDIDSPEASEWFRTHISGGPKDVSHIERMNKDGWMFDDVFVPPAPDPITNYHHVTPGALEDASLPDGFGWFLASLGDLFRASDYNHYAPVYGVARDEARAMDLHWLTDYAPVMCNGTEVFKRFRGHLVYRVGDANMR